MEHRSSRAKHGIIDPQFLLNAYCNAFFPMADSKSGAIHWYSPDPRGIIDLNEFNVSRSLRQTLKKNLFDIRIDACFEEVIRACGERAETWISEEIVQSYVRLHKVGFAHSIETWRDDKLVGGLYGVAIRGAFFGESMFSREPNSSKVALVHLVERLRSRGYALLDTQFITAHLEQFGAREIPRSEYMARLESALMLDCRFV